MPRTRVILGYTEAGNLANPQVVYAGPSGGEAEAMMAANTSCLRFEVLEGPGRRKNNSKYRPVTADEAAPVETTAADEAAPLELATETAARGRGRK